MISGTQTAPPTHVPQCALCGTSDQPLRGEGGFKKRCKDELACTRRMAEAARPTPPRALSVAPRPQADRTPLRTAMPTRPTSGTTAEALIAIMEGDAEPLSGPIAFGEALNTPLAAAQDRYVLFGKPGAGKTNSSAVMAENCIENDIPVCIVDTLGNLWGLRAPGDGPGLAIPIVGGDHGDIGLDVDDAELLADIFATGQSLLIDLSLLATPDQQDFSLAFFRRLSAVLRRPSHVIVEEAETLCPAFCRSKAHFASQGAVILFARQIRNFGVGWTFSTQKPQLLHPDVIDAASAFLPMQTTGDRAQRAIARESKSRIGKIIATAILDELGRLKRGEAWLIPDPLWCAESNASPRRFRFRKRSTYDSTQVPKFGEATSVVPALVPVDLTAFQSANDAPDAKKASATNRAARRSARGRS